MTYFIPLLRKCFKSIDAKFFTYIDGSSNEGDLTIFVKLLSAGMFRDCRNDDIFDIVIILDEMLDDKNVVNIMRKVKRDNMTLI
jgi:hypothetical protein